ncbi:MAG: radical SAM protein [Lachnospiraceae bacterium]|nr:radical SAM protein [Lachnospiraceae bacterium]
MNEERSRTEISEAKQNICGLCPRECTVDRSTAAGFCGMTDTILVSRAALHMWEEPVISGTNGSGTVFFTGCNLKCIFCQNYEIAHTSPDMRAKAVTPDALSDLFFMLKEKGAHNINLVTPTHFIPQIREALLTARTRGLNLPIVYNTSSYETVGALRMLAGLIDVYLPDLKFCDPALSKEYANAPDYFDAAQAAIREMFRQVGEPVFADGLMKKGIIARHLVLPGHTNDSKNILDYLYETYHDRIYISIMNQYTPMPRMKDHPLLGRKVTKREYERVIDYALDLGIQNAFIQEGDVAKESFIPPFDLTGL